jgi:hypothetical protein
VKVFEGYFYVLRSYIKLLKFAKISFRNDPLIEKDGKNLKHIVIIPIYTEPYTVIEEAVLSLGRNDYRYMENVTILLATEARAPDAENHANEIITHYGTKLDIINIVHPVDLPGE